LGVKQVLRFERIRYEGARATHGAVRATSPERFSFIATREGDTLRLDVRVKDALGTKMRASGFRRVFLQMRGQFALTGRLLGETVADSGMGFFETYVIAQ
jgi:ribosomal protein L19